MGDLEIDSPCYNYPYGFVGWQHGAQGSQGPQGRQGRQGPQGNQGNQGPQGPQGNQGAQGPQGNQGSQGTQGNQGNQGNQGAIGLQGAGGTACVLKYWFDSGGSDLSTPVSTGNTIAFVDSNPDTITRIAGNFVADGWVAGQRVTVSGASQPGNNSTFSIATVAANVLTLSSADALSTELAGANVTLLITDDRFVRIPPTGAEVDKSVDVTGADVNGVPINNFITIAGIPGELSIPAGVWEFNGWFWASVASEATVEFQLCKRDLGGATNVLFTTVASPTITATTNPTAQVIQLSYNLLSPITLAETDRLVVRVLAFSAVPNTVHFIYDDWSRASYVKTTYPSDLYSNDLPTPITVGGINNGSTFLDIPLVGMWDTLLYPELFPALTNPNNAFALTQAGLREIDELIAVLNFSALFNRGSINPAYGTSGFRSGLPNTYSYTGTGLPASVGSVLLTDAQIVNNYNVLTGTQAWTNIVSYDAGEQPKSNKGNDYDAPLAAGDTSAKTVSIIGVYPYFATTVVISAPLTKQPLALMNSDYVQTNMVLEDDVDKQKAEFPVVWSAITGIQFYNTVSGTWEWLNGTKANSLSTFTTSATTNTIQEIDIDYTRYTHNGSKVGARQLRWYTT